MYLASTTLVDDKHSKMTAWQPACTCVQLISPAISEVTVLITKIRCSFYNLGKVAHSYFIKKLYEKFPSAESLTFIYTFGVWSLAIIFSL